MTANEKAVNIYFTEDEAVRLYFEFSSRFGWKGTFFAREDAQSSWNEYHDKEGDLPDDIWEAVQNSWCWRKGLSEILTERGWELVHEAVSEALSKSDDQLEKSRLSPPPTED